jgi:hypothetical protein
MSRSASTTASTLQFVTKPSSESVAGMFVFESTLKFAVLPPRSVSPHAVIISAWMRSRRSTLCASSDVWQNVSVPLALAVPNAFAWMLANRSAACEFA